MQISRMRGAGTNLGIQWVKGCEKAWYGIRWRDCAERKWCMEEHLKRGTWVSSGREALAWQHGRGIGDLRHLLTLYVRGQFGEFDH
jgi:hypothetical protein